MFFTSTDFTVLTLKNWNLCFIWLSVFCVSGNQNDLFWRNGLHKFCSLSQDTQLSWFEFSQIRCILIRILETIKVFFSGKFSSKTSDDQTPDPLYQMPNFGVFLKGYCQLVFRRLIPIIRCLIMLIRCLILPIRRLNIRQCFMVLCQDLIRCLIDFIRHLTSLIRRLVFKFWISSFWPFDAVTWLDAWCPASDAW